LNGIIPLTLPLNLPSRAKKIGQLIQSQLPNPPNRPSRLPASPKSSTISEAPSSDSPSISPLPQKGQYSPLLLGDNELLIYEILSPAVRKVLPPARAPLYNDATDNGKETNPPQAPPTLRGNPPRSADEIDTLMAPLTLPESVTEVVRC